MTIATGISPPRPCLDARTRGRAARARPPGSSRCVATAGHRGGARAPPKPPAPAPWHHARESQPWGPPFPRGRAAKPWSAAAREREELVARARVVAHGAEQRRGGGGRPGLADAAHAH